MVDGSESGPTLPFNTVEFMLTNLSTSGETITGMSLTVGDAAVFNFDQVYLSQELFTPGAAQTAQLLVGDRSQDGAVTDLFTYAFTGFVAGDSFRGQFDIDQDNGAFQADARLVLFNNGAAPNAVWSLTFSDGSTASLALPDGPLADSAYTFVIPAPSPALALSTLSCSPRERVAPRHVRMHRSPKSPPRPSPAFPAQCRAIASRLSRSPSRTLRFDAPQPSCPTASQP